MEFINRKGEKVEFDPFEATDVKILSALPEGEFFLLNGPGINGMQANSMELMQKHTEAGELIDMTDKTQAGGMSATIENCLRRQVGTGTHEPKIRIIEAGSSYAGLTKLIGGDSDSIAIKKP